MATTNQMFPNLQRYALPDGLQYSPINTQIYTEQKMTEFLGITEEIARKDIPEIGKLEGDSKKNKIKEIAYKLRNMQTFLASIEQTEKKAPDILTLTLKNFVNAGICRLESEIKNADMIFNTQLELGNFSKFAKVMTEYGVNPTLEKLKNAYEEARKVNTDIGSGGSSGGGGGGGGGDSSEYPFDMKKVLRKIKTDPNQNITFNNVVGSNELKSNLLAIINSANERSGKITKPERSLLLYGPPGTGKTLTITAFANESKRTLYSLSGDNLLSSYQGDSEKILKAVFDDAARQPSIIFIDEIDTFFQARTSSTANTTSPDANKTYSQNNSETLQSQLFTLLSGIDSDKYRNVFFIGATNRTNVLDTALWRRLKRKIFTPLPDKLQRNEILHFYLTNKYKTNIANIDFDIVGDRTQYLSHSDLSLLCENILEDRATEVLTSEYFQFGLGNLFYIDPTTSQTQNVVLLPISTQPTPSDPTKEITDCSIFINRSNATDPTFYKFQNNILRSQCDFIGYKFLTTDNFSSDIIKSISSSTRDVYYNILKENNFSDIDANAEADRI